MAAIIAGVTINAINKTMAVDHAIAIANPLYYYAVGGKQRVERVKLTEVRYTLDPIGVRLGFKDSRGNQHWRDFNEPRLFNTSAEAKTFLVDEYAAGVDAVIVVEDATDLTA